MAPNIIGLLTIVPPGVAADEHELSLAVSTSDARSCKGKFASGQLSDEDEGTRMTNFFTACEAQTSQTLVYYTALPRKAGGYYLFATMNFDGNTDAAKNTDANIRNAVLRTN
jgi:hypothetical protein